MCARRAAQLRCARGSAAVGFGVVAPVLLMMVFAIIDLARLAIAVVSLREAAAIAVRAAAVGRTEAEAAALAIGRTPLAAHGLVFDIRCSALTMSGGTTAETPIPCGTAIDPTALRRVRVTATGEFRFLLPYLPTGTIPIVQRTEVTS